MPVLPSFGDRSEAVLDLQLRLGAQGHRCDPDELGEFADGTKAAVRQFQAARGLRVDGVVDHHTWSSLVESGLALGDRLLYFRQPMLRGDDVTALQQRLNLLGFDARRVDGLFGADTHRALVEFQRSAGLVADGICGPSTVEALGRVSTLADGSIAAVRERDALRHGPRLLVGRRVFVAATPGLAVIGDNVARGLNLVGATAVFDQSGDDESVLARGANQFSADLYFGIALGTEPGARCVYFATSGFRSELGAAVATAVCDALVDTIAIDDAPEVTGRAYPVLRETRMTAVVCELAPLGDAAALAAVVARSGAVARALVRGVQRGWEQPPDSERSSDPPPTT